MDTSAVTVNSAMQELLRAYVASEDHRKHRQYWTQEEKEMVMAVYSTIKFFKPTRSLRGVACRT